MKVADIPEHWTKKLKFHKVTPLWHQSFYDGPLDGIVEFRGRKMYACIVEADFREAWALYALTDEETKLIEAQHELFRQHVGTHADYGSLDEYRAPASEHHLFYDNKLPKVDFTVFEGREIAGWCRNPFWSS